jgi:Synergist-CTERM protein sorting domain-containing protein
VARTVTASATIWGSVGLTGMTGPDQQAPQVAISFPADAAQLDLAVFNLTGNASDNAGPVATVDLQLNGGAATAVPVSSGAFSVQVKLKPGTNTLKVTAKDAAGNVGTATSTAVFNAGVTGFVHVSEDEAQRVAGATVQLREPGTGAVVSTSTTDASGAFSLAAATVPVDYVLFVKAPGFVSSSQTVTVPEDQRLKMNVGLTMGEDLSGAGSIRFSDPLEGATISTESVIVYGSVSGFEVAGVKVNGVQAELLGAGGFTATVPVKEGANTLEAVATGLGTESALGTLHITRKLASNSMGQPKDPKAASGGCNAAGGLSLMALSVVVPLLRRRRNS